MELGTQLSPCCKRGNDTGPKGSGRVTETEPEDFPQISVSHYPQQALLGGKFSRTWPTSWCSFPSFPTHQHATLEEPGRGQETGILDTEQLFDKLSTTSRDY